MDGSGANTTYSPVDLMPLQGSSNKVHLPTVLAKSDFQITTGSQTISGLVATFAKFNFKMCPQANALAMQGTLVAQKFIVAGRNEFNLSGLIWSTMYTLFTTQLNNPPATRVPYFPTYMNGLGLVVDPKMTFALPATATTYVWPSDGMTIYVANSADGGLRWELISWQDMH